MRSGLTDTRCSALHWTNHPANGGPLSRSPDRKDHSPEITNVPPGTLLESVIKRHPTHCGDKEIPKFTLLKSWCATHRRSHQATPHHHQPRASH